MNTISNQSQCLILALTSDAGDLDVESAEWACHALAWKPNPSLCSPTSVLTLLPPSPPDWEFRSHNGALCLPTQRKTLPYGAAQKPQMRINLHATRPHPNYIGCPGH